MKLPQRAGARSSVSWRSRRAGLAFLAVSLVACAKEGAREVDSDTGGASHVDGGASGSGGAFMSGSGGRASVGGSSAAPGGGGTSAVGASAGAGSGAAGLDGASWAGASAAAGSGPAGGNTSGSGGSDAGRSAGCSRASYDTARRQLSLQAGGAERGFFVVPPTTSSEPVPLVIGFHGYGGTGLEVADWWRLDQDAGGRLLGVYPDGLAQDWYGGAVGWDVRTAESADVALFDAVLAWALENYCVDLGRVHAVGFSWGGWMANHVGCVRPDAVRSIVSVAGGGPMIDCPAAVTALVVHGTGDTAEPIEEGRSSASTWRTAAGCSDSTVAADPEPCVEYLGCSSGKSVFWCEHDGGHGWVPFLEGGGLLRWLAEH